MFDWKKKWVGRAWLMALVGILAGLLVLFKVIPADKVDATAKFLGGIAVIVLPILGFQIMEGKKDIEAIKANGKKEKPDV